MKVMIFVVVRLSGSLVANLSVKPGVMRLENALFVCEICANDVVLKSRIARLTRQTKQSVGRLATLAACGC